MIKIILVVCFSLITLKSQILYEHIFYPINGGGSYGYFPIINDSLIFISAHQDNINGNSSGSLYYYRNGDSNWTFIKKIVPNGGHPNDFFGIPYLYNGYLYVGAFGNRGAVHIFKHENNDWIEVQKLVPDTLIYLSSFGISIVEHKNQLLIGADSDSRFVDGSGTVYVYKNSNDGIWEKFQKIYPVIMKEYAHFGYKIEINSKYNNLFISAPEDSNDAGLFAGNVYIFHKPDSLWEIKQILSPDIGEAFPYFGGSIKTQEDYLFVGAPGSGSTQSGGSVYVYKIINGNWKFQKKIISPINLPRDYFGYSLFIEGDKLLIGAPGESVSGNRRSFAYLYKYFSDEWVLEHIFTPSDSNYFDSFGIGLAMNKGSYLIGAYSSNRAYLYTPYPISVDENISFLRDYVLSQNYPNPFNPMTKIKFSLPKSEIVQIKVYNILGKEIQTLLNEYKKAGTYEVDFDASNLPSGVYFYRMISGSYSETKKMILLR